MYIFGLDLIYKFILLSMSMTTSIHIETKKIDPY
jgi:hypothetical protein